MSVLRYINADKTTLKYKRGVESDSQTHRQRGTHTEKERDKKNTLTDGRTESGRMHNEILLWSVVSLTL